MADQPDARFEPWAPDWAPTVRTGAPHRQPPIPGAVYAEFPLRAVAFAIDVLLINLLAGALSQALGMLEVLAPPPDLFTATSGTSALLAVAYLVGTLAITALALYFWRVFRATPGQMMLGLFVVQRATGNGLSIQAALLRWLLLYAPLALQLSGRWLSTLIVSDDPYNPVNPNFVIAATVLLPVLWYALLVLSVVADRRRGRGLHDLAAGSVVIRRAGAPS
jgi:uncharacterized RDD family membrane protein YckC